MPCMRSFRTMALIVPLGFLPQFSVSAAHRPQDATRRFIVDSAGNRAGYHVREQLASISFPTDAVGTTDAVRGALVLGPDGAVVRDSSHFVVDLTGLTSDRSMRDRFIQRNTLETARYPTAEFAVTGAAGLPNPVPQSGRADFRLTGDLTIHGVTRPATWQVSARFEPGAVTGTASTRFTFADFGMTPPHVMIVLSVADTIGLEYDFRLVPDTTGK
jgi:polyisoprenoid-binding protein YceI